MAIGGMSKLDTVRVPDSFLEDFEKAEELVKRYFAERLDTPSRGTIEISGERYVLVRAAALSVEFFDLVEKLYGPGREPEAQSFARNILFDLAHAIGKSDARNFHTRMGLSDPVARLSAGPVHFAYSGWASVDIDAASAPSADGDYLFVYDHPYSFESDAWTKAGRSAEFPVCIMNAGYSSGWCEESFGMPLVASEVLCRARGDAHCRFVMAPPDQLEHRLDEYVADKPALALRVRGYEIPDFFARKAVEEELRATRDELEQRVIQRTRDLERANDKLRREMAERERILRRVQNTQRLESLGRLAGGVAHDFNNLLGVIMGYSTVLEGRVADDDPMKPMLGEITEAAQLAAHLTRQLLTFSRGRVVTMRRIDLHQVVEGVSNMLNRLVGDDVTIRTALTPREALVEADPSQVEQMLMNLAVNARDAMPTGGALTIATELVDDDGAPADEPTGVKLSVIDTGQGMTEELQTKIFEPFFSTKEENEATGLGLSTVYGIVTQIGGTVAVTSEVGEGTRFDIVLPLAQEPTMRLTPVSNEGEPGEDPEPRPAGRTSRLGTVLLVEDSVSLRSLLAEALAEDRYDVLVAQDGHHAVELAREHPDIDVLVADVTMPDVDGWELAVRLATERPGIRVLFMSGVADATPRDDRLADVETDFLAKPFTPLEMREALDRLLAPA